MNQPNFSTRESQKNTTIVLLSRFKHQFSFVCVYVCVCAWTDHPLTLFLAVTRTALSCACWRPTTRMMWLCRSTSRCSSRFSVRATSPSCGCRDWGGSSSCSAPPWMPTETKRSTETSTAFWLRWADSSKQASSQTAMSLLRLANVTCFCTLTGEKIVESSAKYKPWIWIFIFLCRTPWLTTAGCKRLGPTTRRDDASTSGCPNSSCRNARHPGSTDMREKRELSEFWCSQSKVVRAWRSCSGFNRIRSWLTSTEGSGWAEKGTGTRKSVLHHLPVKKIWLLLWRTIFFNYYHYFVCCQKPHPDAKPGVPVCFLWRRQECCNDTMPNIPMYSDMGESLEWRCVCVSVNAWYARTMPGSLYRKDWVCCVRILAMSSWNLRRRCRHGSQSENDAWVKFAQDF